MRILHISDLHVSPPETLSDAWAPVEAYLQANLSSRDKFDFIVVSGDLSERAQPEEFEALGDLVSQDLLRRLPDDDRMRVIFVPGNHDVLWNDDHFKPVLQGRDTTAAVESVKKDPHSSPYRQQLTDVGTLQLWEVKKAEYAQRFANVQKFFDDFYGPPSTDKTRKKFNLLEPASDWSCHPFLDQGIVFVGLNSCHRTDKHWQGAGFDRRAIDLATRHVRDLRELQPNLLIVAVWHHGFASDQARPDRLTLVDLGRLYNMGARLGLHGHTHLADMNQHERLDGSLRVLATGSLGAGREALPDRTPNQFSILELGPDASHVQVDTLRLNHQLEYEPTPSKTYALALASNAQRTGVPSRTSCKLHRRTCKVDADGVKHVTVEMQGLLPFGNVQLAVVVPPYGSSSTRDQLLFANEPQEVLDKRLAGGKHRYAVDLKPKLGDLKWEYDVSNSVALTKEELLLLPSRSESHPNILAHEDACAFVPAFGCERLELEAQFERTPAFQSARVLVERRSGHGSGTEWEVDDIETARVRGSFAHSSNAEGPSVMTLGVGHPLVGRRYSLVFAPGPEGRPYPRDAKFLAKDVLDACRGEHFAESKLRHDLTLTLGAALTEQLQSDVGEWVAHLWHADDRILLPAFGQFPSCDWESCFEAGSGIAGHAFRHSAVVGWCNDVPGFSQSVYRKSAHRPGHRAPEHQWVLCLPLRVNEGGPAIGVVGLARSRSKTAAEKLCEGYVRSLAERPQGSSELIDLVGAVAVAFWTALSTSEALTPGQRLYSQNRLEEFQQPVAPSSPQP